MLKGERVHFILLILVLLLPLVTILILINGCAKKPVISAPVEQIHEIKQEPPPPTIERDVESTSEEMPPEPTPRPIPSPKPFEPHGS